MLLVMLIVTSLGCVVLSIRNVRAKSDISFLEAKCADLLYREEMLKALAVPMIVGDEEPQKMIGNGEEEMDPISSNKEELFVYQDTEEQSVINRETLIEVDLDENTFEYLSFLGVYDSQSHSQVHVELENEVDELDQLILFSDSELSTPTAPSLEAPGLHFWTGEIVQKYSDDLVAVTNGSYTYHLSHPQFRDFECGEPVYLQVQVGGEDEFREVKMVWQPEIAEISA
ncbi:hypothetical protein [Paenibacillus tepidiphilus]|uniref:hypothetical protein n=1 Tax=Paenibacillus tepidiphilus TaxID=2608683 RepID=UPI00123BB625|nr:hypothetical protein [Paenibacillus tepidiphilus]